MSKKKEVSGKFTTNMLLDLSINGIVYPVNIRVAITSMSYYWREFCITFFDVKDIKPKGLSKELRKRIMDRIYLDNDIFNKVVNNLMFLLKGGGVISNKVCRRKEVNW